VSETDRLLDVNMTDPVPRDVLLRFRDEKALPKIVRVYSPEHGWVSSPLRGVLTEALAAELKQRGFTSVGLKWHRTTKQVSLL
jgi:hypothetical protein